MIDTATTPFMGKILETCKDKNVRLIVLTHGHVDHIQNAAALSKALKAPIAMNKADYSLIKNNMEQPMTADTLMGKILLAVIMKSLRSAPIESFEPEVFLNDGDTLDNFGMKAKVIGLPGHTKGSIGIMIGGDVFVGDALMNMFRPSLSLLYGEKQHVFESAEKISALVSVTIHFGHGKSVSNRTWR